MKSETQKILFGISKLLARTGDLDMAILVLDTMVTMLNGISSYEHADAVLAALEEADNA